MIVLLVLDLPGLNVIASRRRKRGDQWIGSVGYVIGATNADCASLDHAEVVEDFPEVAFDIARHAMLHVLAVAVLPGRRHTALIIFVGLQAKSEITMHCRLHNRELT